MLGFNVIAFATIVIFLVLLSGKKPQLKAPQGASSPVTLNSPLGRAPSITPPVAYITPLQQFEFRACRSKKFRKPRLNYRKLCFFHIEGSQKQNYTESKCLDTYVCAVGGGRLQVITRQIFPKIQARFGIFFFWKSKKSFRQECGHDEHL